MLRSDPKPFYISARPSRHGQRMLRVRALRMGFVVVMVTAIFAAPVVMLIGGSGF
jgi:hypothetical protein